MPAIKIEGFTGIAPRMGPTLLANSQAQTASDIKLQSGELRPWRKESFVVAAPIANAVSIYKALGPAGASEWLAWNTDVDIVNSPVADTSDFRFYYTGSGTPKKANWATRAAPLEMGVLGPTAAPTLSAAGGSAPTETRAYIYTHVSAFGSITEESAPSPAALVTCNSAGATVTVSGFSALPAGSYNITARRIYRSVTGATSTVYLFVAELPVATASFADNLTVVQLGITPLASLNYTPPPAGLTGLVSMPNGMMAGFVDNQIWFSEPYLPHAWPATYVLTTEFKVVGLGVFGTTLVVMTTKNPYMITGSHPASLTQEKLSMTQACVSKRSIAFDQHGVLYASPYGLVHIGSGEQDVITTPILTPDEWQTYFPSSFTSILFGNFYLGFYSNLGVNNAVVLARNSDTPAMSSFSFPATALFLERTTGKLFACSSLDNSIYQLDASTVNNTTYTWRSKLFVAPSPVNFSTMQVNADFDYLSNVAAILNATTGYVATNTAIFTAGQTSGILGGEVNAAMVNVYGVNANSMLDGIEVPYPRFVQITLYADHQPVYTTSLTSFEPVRLPAGFKAYEWEIKITGNVPVRGFNMATSMAELKQVTGTMPLHGTYNFPGMGGV